MTDPRIQSILNRSDTGLHFLEMIREQSPDSTFIVDDFAIATMKWR